jgi:hypothetical protein
MLTPSQHAASRMVSRAVQEAPFVIELVTVVADALRLDGPRRAGGAERAVDVRHHRRGRYPAYRRVVSRYPIVRWRIEHASSARWMPPPQPVACRILDEGGQERHGQACPGGRCVRRNGRTHHGYSGDSCRHSRCGKRAAHSRSHHPTHLSLLQTGLKQVAVTLPLSNLRTISRP